MFDWRTNRLLYFGVWCAILTIAYMYVTSWVFHDTGSLKCSEDGEHFVFKECKYGSLIYLIGGLATIHFSAVFRVVFFRINNRAKLPREV